MYFSSRKADGINGDSCVANVSARAQPAAQKTAQTHTHVDELAPIADRLSNRNIKMNCLSDNGK